jgi:hypothetical protein
MYYLGDVEGIIDKLTNKTVEVAVLRRSFLKASTSQKNSALRP